MEGNDPLVHPRGQGYSIQWELNDTNDPLGIFRARLINAVVPDTHRVIEVHIPKSETSHDHD